MNEEIKILPREKYINEIAPFIGQNLIKVLTGQRRVGKSYILESVARHISQNDATANIIRIDLEDFSFAHITNANELHQAIISKLENNCRNYIFIDEIQEITDFDKVIRSLAQSPTNDIYVTGSNSKMLSGEIASRLAGRHIEIKVHPLSYSEFLFFHKSEDTQEAIEEYLQYGGLPFLINLPQKQTWNDYIRSVSDAIFYRDVVTRHNIRNNDFLQRLLLFLADNIGQIVTAKRISDFLKSQRISISANSVISYIDYIEEACIINNVRRWNIEGKRFFEIGEKYYFEDLGVRNSITGYRPNDRSSVLENAVYNHLIYSGYDVTIGQMTNGHEIDFIARKAGETIYIQVALQIDRTDTFEREFGNLMQLNDNYPKMIVTLHDTTPNTYKGIELLSLRQFLMKK